MFFKKNKEKDFKMIWEIRKDGRRSFLAGTAHFFPDSFRGSLSRYIEKARTVMFEGPLDKESMAKVVRAGTVPDRAENILDRLDGESVREISRLLFPVCKGRNPYLLMNPRTLKTEDLVFSLTKNMKPWLAFFTLWTTYLEENGWKHSVDMEAHAIALEMGKEIIFMETIEEQIRVLEGLSSDRILAFLARARDWHTIARDYADCYRRGDLDRMKSTGLRFPSRHYSVIDRRDQLFFDRMQPYLEKGDALVFVGAPHMKGIGQLLSAQGYETSGPSAPAGP